MKNYKTIPCLLSVLFLIPMLAFAQDSDGDGLDDQVETNTGVFVSLMDTGTDPNIADTDADGFNDGLEVGFGTDPINPASSLFQGKVVAGDAAFGDSFGYSVSMSDDYAMVGAPFEDAAGTSAGAVYVFKRDGLIWTEQQKLTASDAGAGDQFGFSVTLSGDYLVVGANKADNGGIDTGAAYVFKRDGNVWSEQAKLLPSDIQLGDQFGSSVSVSGNTAFIGSLLEDSAGNDAGAVYVFTRDGTGWSELQKITASDVSAGDQFGISISIDGGSALIGAGLGDAGGAIGIDVGAAYVFVRGSTLWTEQQKLNASDFQSGDGFGRSVALSGDTALIGAQWHDASGANAGAAYTFTRSNTLWSEQQKLIGSDLQAGDSFGFSVALLDGNALIGAYLSDAAGAFSGAAYLFSLDGGVVWNGQHKLIASDAAGSDTFGFTVALSADVAFVGANLQDAGATDTGAAYHFNLDADQDGLLDFVETDTGTFVDATDTGTDPLLSDTDGDGLLDGFEVSYGFDALGTDEAAIDFDNDGLNNLSEQDLGTNPMVADTDDDGFSDGMEAGFGTNPTDPLQNPLKNQLRASDYQSGDRFGFGVAVFGDIAVIGAPWEDGGPTCGAVYVFSRSGSLWTEQQKLVASDGGCTDLFGVSVAISSDTIMVGSYLNDGSAHNAGAVYMFVQSGGLWSEQQKLVASDAGTSDSFGFSVSLSGDTAVVGATGEEAAYVFQRVGGVWSEQQKLTSSVLQGEFGYSVSISGDSIAVGAYLDAIAGYNAGAVHVFTRNGSVWSEQQKLTATDAEPNHHFGRSVAIDGDTLLIGAPRHDLIGNSRGAAYVFARTGAAWSEQQLLSATQQVLGFGSKVALSGNTAAIGSSSSSSFEPNVYVFKQSGSLWSVDQQYAVGENTAFVGSYDNTIVATSGDVLLVGAWESDGDFAYDNAGLAFTFNLDQLLADTDGDGLLDGFEIAHGFDPYNTNESLDDNDNDGLNNLEEQAANTNPTLNDTDMDGVSDGDEIANGTDPLVNENSLVNLNIPVTGLTGLLALFCSLMAFGVYARSRQC